MEYAWDENKRHANLAKREVDFTAVTDFIWESARIAADLRKDYGEPRFIATGYIGERLHVLVFTPRADEIRLIGLRIANPREIKRYETET
jgi:uncharacterized protein